MSTLEQITKETLERVVRMESRLVQLGDHVGANLRSKQKIEIIPAGAHSSVAHVEVDSLDVSASRILTELRQAGINQHEVDVHCNGRIAFTLYINHRG